MKTAKIIGRISAVTILCGALAAGCGFSQPKGGDAPGTGQPGAAQPGQENPLPGTPVPTVTFTQVSQQILQAKCISCHSGSNSPNLSSYAGFASNTTYIVPGNPAGSSLYNAVQTGAMPQGGPALSAAELALIYDWIQEGALNN